jgi:hypothetical protein
METSPRSRKNEEKDISKLFELFKTLNPEQQKSFSRQIKRSPTKSLLRKTTTNVINPLIKLGIGATLGYFTQIPLINLASSTFAFHPQIWKLTSTVSNASIRNIFCEDTLESYYFSAELSQVLCNSFRKIVSFILYISVINFVWMYLFAPGPSMIDFTKKFLQSVGKLCLNLKNTMTVCLDESFTELQENEGLQFYKKALQLEGSELVTKLLPDLTETAVSYGAALGLLGNSNDVEDFSKQLISLEKQLTSGKEYNFIQKIYAIGSEWISSGQAEELIDNRENFVQGVSDLSSITKGTFDAISSLTKTLDDFGKTSISELTMMKPEALEQFSEYFYKKIAKEDDQTITGKALDFISSTYSLITSQTPRGTIIENFHGNFVGSVIKLKDTIIGNLQNSKYELVKSLTETESFKKCNYMLSNDIEKYMIDTEINVKKFEKGKKNKVNNDILKFLNVPEIKKTTILPFQINSNVYNPVPEMEQTMYVTSALIIMIFYLLFFTTILKYIFKFSTSTVSKVKRRSPNKKYSSNK